MHFALQDQLSLHRLKCIVVHLCHFIFIGRDLLELLLDIRISRTGRFFGIRQVIIHDILHLALILLLGLTGCASIFDGEILAASILEEHDSFFKLFGLLCIIRRVASFSGPDTECKIGLHCLVFDDVAVGILRSVGHLDVSQIVDSFHFLVVQTAEQGKRGIVDHHSIRNIAVFPSLET